MPTLNDTHASTIVVRPDWSSRLAQLAATHMVSFIPQVGGRIACLIVDSKSGASRNGTGSSMVDAFQAAEQAQPELLDIGMEVVA